MKFSTARDIQRAICTIVDELFHGDDDHPAIVDLFDRYNRDSHALWVGIEQAVADRDADRLEAIVYGE
jgi:hypothetical protein